MAKNDWYSVRSTTTPTLFIITKTDDDDNPTGHYHIAIDPDRPKARPTCTCAGAYRRHTCRHQEIFTLFQGTGRTSTGYRYSFDKKTWKEPLSPE